MREVANNFETHMVYPAANPDRKFSRDYVPTNLPSQRLHKETFQYSPRDFSDSCIDLLKTYKLDLLEQRIIKFPTSSGDRSIKIIFAKPQQDNGEVEVLSHGRYGSIETLYKQGIESYKQGSAFCLVSYRGVDANPGIPSQEANGDAVHAAVEFLKQYKSYPTEKINFTGSSMGSEAVINMIARRARKYKAGLERFGRVRLLAPYLSLYDIAEVSIGRHRIIPRKNEPTTNGLLYPLRKLLAKTFRDPIFNLRDHLPFLYNRIAALEIHASKDDEFIPFGHSERLFKLAHKILGDKIPVTLHTHEGVSHSQISNLSLDLGSDIARRTSFEP